MFKSYLDFEQPIADIESKILELENSDLDPDQIKKEVIGLNESAVKLTESIFLSSFNFFCIRFIKV